MSALGLSAKQIILASLLLVFPLVATPVGFGTNNSQPEGQPAPPNDPPTWNSTPAPSFVLGFSSSYNIVEDHATDPESDTLTLANETGCTLPTGVTIDDANDEVDYDGTGTSGTTTGCVFSVKDTINAKVNSSSFSIIISDIPAAGTIYERDYSGTPRAGDSGANET